MSIEENYDWAKKQRAEWDDLVDRGQPEVSKLDVELSKGGDHPLVGVTFSKIEHASYTGEVGRVEGDLIFHFWPTPDDKYNVLMTMGDEEAIQNGTKREYIWVFGDAFSSALAQAFLDEIKQEDKLCWDFVPELNSWVVRATGFGDNPLAEEMSDRVFANLQGRLEQ